MMTRREFVMAGAAAGLVVARGRGTAQAGAKDAGTLREAGAAKGVLAGCAVAVERLDVDAAYTELLRRQAGIVVAENSMKFGNMRPTPTTFRFDEPDKLLAFAEANGMKMRGHNFVWHRQLPSWWGEFVTRENVRKVLMQHIATVGGRYAGKLHSWDVVNEAIEIKDGLPGGFRNSPWQQMLGGAGGDVPEYIELAFRAARRVDPKAMLTYNDYGIEGEDEGSAKKRAAVLGLLRAMQKKGIPIDALGVQSHVSAGDSSAYGRGLMGLIGDARKMGLKVLVTEMDVNDRTLPAGIKERDSAVAETYGSYLRMVLADPAVVAVLTWGLTDRYTWLNEEDARTDGVKERPLPFDEAMQPKQAFAAERDALRGAASRG